MYKMDETIYEAILCDPFVHVLIIAECKLFQDECKKWFAIITTRFIYHSVKIAYASMFMRIVYKFVVVYRKMMH
jgi:hypothetical protein